MHALARRVTGSTAGALVAGTIWGFWPYHTAHLGHLQLQALYALPLALLALHRLIAGGRRRDALWLGAGRRRSWPRRRSTTASSARLASRWRSIALTVGRPADGAPARVVGSSRSPVRVGAVLVAPFVWPYWQVQQREGFVRNLYEAARHAATPASYVERARGQPALRRRRMAAYRSRAPSRSSSSASSPLALAVARCYRCATARSLATGGVGGGARRRWVRALARPRRPASGLRDAASLGVRLPGDSRAGSLWRAGGARRGAAGRARHARARAMRPARGRRRIRSALGALLPLPCTVLLALIARGVRQPAAAAGRGAARWTTPVGAVAAQRARARRRAVSPCSATTREHAVHGRRAPSTAGRSSTATAGSGRRSSAALSTRCTGFRRSKSMWTLNDLDVRFVVSPEPVDTAALAAGRAGAAAERRHAGQPMRYIYELVWSEDVEARLGPPSTPVPPEPGPMPLSDARTSRTIG